MLVIHEHILQQIKNSLGEKGIELCKEFFQEDINTVINKVLEKELQTRELNEARAYVFKNRFQKTKKRWLKSLKDSLKNNNSPKSKNKELLQEIEYAKDFLHKFDQEKFQFVFQASSIEELKNKRLRDIEEWAANEEQKIIDYPYIQDKTTRQIQTALQTDITMIALNIYTREYDGNTNNVYLELPDQLMSFPLFSVNKGKLNFSKQPLLIDGVEYYAQTYSPDNEDDYSLLTLVWKQHVDGGVVSNQELRLLDEIDEKIYHAVMSNRNNIDFVRNRNIYVDVGSIVAQVYNSLSSKNYAAVVARLNKMAHIKFTFESEDKEYLVFGIFDNIKFSRDQKSAIITINDVIHQQVIERQVTLMYRDVVNKLEISMPKTIVFAVQKERLRCHLEEGKTQSVFTYDFFVYRLQFRKKSKKMNIEIIENYLSEMQRQQVIIKTYRRVEDKFYVDFIPVKEYEVRDIVRFTQKKQSIRETSLLETTYY